MPSRYRSASADVSGRGAKFVKELSHPAPSTQRDLAAKRLKGLKKENGIFKILPLLVPLAPLRGHSSSSFALLSLHEPVDDSAKFDYPSPPHIIENGGVAKWEGRGLQNLYEWVRLPPPPPIFRFDMQASAIDEDCFLLKPRSHCRKKRLANRP